MKYIKRIAALVLAGVMSLSLLTGCRPGGGTSSSGSGSAPGNVSAGEVDLAAITDICQYVSGIPADRELASVNGIGITAGELMYWIVSDVDNIMSYYAYMGMTSDPWQLPGEDGQTMSQFLLEDALNLAAMQRLVEHHATEHGMAVTDADKKAIQDALAAMQADLEESGVTMDQYLWQYMLTPELYTWNCECDYLYGQYATEHFGEGTEGFPDYNDVLNDLESRNAYSVKHILLSTVDTLTGQALGDAAVVQKKAQAEDLLKQLRGSSDMPALFDELMNEYSEDPGLYNNPNGYTFAVDGSVDPAFEEAALALEIGQLSDIVEGISGFHIILRLPLEVDVEAARNTYISSQMAALGEQWLAEADIQRTEEYNALDAQAIYQTVCDLRDKITEIAQAAQDE